MKYVLLKKATKDIFGIKSYLAERNPKASEKIVLEFEKISKKSSYCF